ncbi:hypothetical protein FSP39_009187 [Pinctada imbricata]|uniref:Ribosomal L1 domain-containing protein 1 n=1 Tax=Pinctada imbricata TaxID=66713 RepID=A0AA88XIH9_PINIB|nr:hypothetical protein FSP39_009187 [Pinctada imbricata]
MVEMKLDVQRSDVVKAVDVLLKLGEKDKDFLNERSRINLTFSMKKVPDVVNKVISIPLPHGLATPELDVCLFVKDLDTKSREVEMTEEHVVDLLREKDVKCVTKVIPVKALKLEYKPFEAKRNLSNMYDIFLADKRIYGALPPLLGKAFYGRKRVPVQVNMLATDLKTEIENAINSGSCTMKGKGSSCMATVAHSRLDAAQIVDNVMEAINRIVTQIPGGAENIRNFYLKTDKSMAIPVYVSLTGSKDVVLPAKPKKMDTTIIEEIDTVEDGKVRVKLTGEVDYVTEDGIVPSDEQRKAIRKKLKYKAKRMKIKRRKEKAGKEKKNTSSKPEKKSDKRKVDKEKDEHA